MAKSKRRKTARKYRPSSASKRSTTSALEKERLRRYALEIDLAGGKARPRLLSLLFCDLANQTTDQKMNLIGVFDRVFVHPDVKTSPRFFIYGRTAQAFEDNLWVRVFDPDDEPQVEIRFDPPPKDILDKDRNADDPKQMQFYIPIQMTFTKQGTYWFDVSYQNFSLGGAGLVVRHRKLGESENATDTFI